MKQDRESLNICRATFLGLSISEIAQKNFYQEASRWMQRILKGSERFKGITGFLLSRGSVGGWLWYVCSQKQMISRFLSSLRPLT